MLEQTEKHQYFDIITKQRRNFRDDTKNIFLFFVPLNHSSVFGYTTK